MKAFLKRLFSKDNGNKFPQSKQVIEFAFECGGVKYYKHADAVNIPPKRALKALTIYRELEIGIDALYMDSFLKAFEKIITGNKITIPEISQLHTMYMQLKARFEFHPTADHILKLASVRFFDENENPNDYDFKYAEKKIEFWKKHKADDFFLSVPMVNLIPSLKDVGGNLESYSEVVAKIDAEHLEFLSKIIAPNQKETLPTSLDRLFWKERLTEK